MTFAPVSQFLNRAPSVTFLFRINFELHAQRTITPSVFIPIYIQQDATLHRTALTQGQISITFEYYFNVIHSDVLMDTK